MFGFKLVKKSEYDAEIERYRSQRADAFKAKEKAEKDLAIQIDLNREERYRYENLKNSISKNRHEGLLEVDIGDPTPEKNDIRREYVSRVAGFYKDILKPKCLQMISVFHKLLEEETNDHDTNQYLKMGVYICREFMKWGDQAVNEHVANSTEKPETPKQKEETINSTVIL